jgi:type VI secretion system secreted protein Hcp
MTARRLFACLLTSACALALLLAPAASAAPELFLRLDGIPGESTNSRHANEIDVLAYSWGVSAPAGARPAFQNLSITKRVDRASPSLLLSAAGNRVIPSATLSVGEPGASAQDFLRYCMTNVRVEDLSTSGSAGDRPTESVSLSYGTIFQSYRRQNPDGTLSTPFVGGFDLVRSVLLSTGTC